MKAVVFGGSGFLGSHVGDALTESKFDVVLFDRKPSPYLKKNQEMVRKLQVYVEKLKNRCKVQ